MAETGNIFDNQEAMSDEQLLSYLKGKLTAEELHEVEKQMADSAFVNDAVEGLQDFSSNKKLEDYVAQLNTQLGQQLNVRKQQKEKRKIKDLQWPLVAVAIILVLCLVAYAVIRMFQHR